MKRLRVKPSRGMSLAGLVGGIVMIALGVVWAIPTFGAFGVAWTLIALAVTGYHAFNSLSGRGVATQEIDIEDLGSPSLEGGRESNRLERLENLRTRNLITEEEYRRKRAEIIRDSNCGLTTSQRFFHSQDWK